MRPVLIVAAVTALAIAAGSLALAQDSVAPPTQPAPYLTPEQTPEASLILPPAPVDGTDRYAQDRAIFKSTRSMAGTPRWVLAQADNNLTTDYLLKAFSCSVGVNLTPANAPRLNSLLARALVDDGHGSARAKQVFQRKRPYLIDDGDICIAKSDSLARSFDYPSGHTTLSWTVGLIFAELVPEHSTAILSRARAYGESRVVCGVHNASAIEGGRTTGATVYAALHASAEFRADMEAAKAEISAARANANSAPDAAMCKVEADLTAKTPYSY
jgi:acid phosphatase (class A)